MHALVIKQIRLAMCTFDVLQFMSELLTGSKFWTLLCSDPDPDLIAQSLGHGTSSLHGELTCQEILKFINAHMAVTEKTHIIQTLVLSAVTLI